MLNYLYYPLWYVSAHDAHVNADATPQHNFSLLIDWKKDRISEKFVCMNLKAHFKSTNSELELQRLIEATVNSSSYRVLLRSPFFMRLLIFTKRTRRTFQSSEARLFILFKQLSHLIHFPYKDRMFLIHFKDIHNI